MENKTAIQFPRYIDKPKMIGIFEIDEVMVGAGAFFTIFFLGFATSAEPVIIMPLGLLIMIVTSYTIKKYKVNYPDNFLFHLAYRKGYIHPVFNDTRLNKRFDIKNGAKILPTGYVVYFYE